MGIRNFFSNLRSQFVPKQSGSALPLSPVLQRPQSGAVQSVISRSDAQTGVKTPISKTPVRYSPASAQRVSDR